MRSIRMQKFEVEIATKLRDGCGNEVKPLTPGDIRRALMGGLPYHDGVSVLTSSEDVVENE